MSRLLVVDDEANQRRSLAAGLRIEGFEVEVACSGLEALDLMARDPFDLVILDMMMPVMNGLECARQVHARFPRTRVALTSAYHLTEAQIERLNVGIVGFVPKPCRLDELATFVRAKLDRNPSSMRIPRAVGSGV